MIPAPARRALEDALGERVRFEVPLARYTSLRVGGPADALALPGDRAELALLLRLCRRFGLPHTVLGGGFNLLVLDGGVPGVVIRLSELRRIEERPGFALRVEAGATHASVMRACVDAGLGGLEFAAAIPGTLGGWIAMNAGVPDREIESRVLEVELMSPTGRRRRHLPRKQLGFGYRRLHGLAPGSVIVSALLGLEPSSPARVRAAVERALAARRGRQPLDLPSCGSVFENPPGERAGRLIELAGLKGARAGGAEISSLHANFIVNRGGATARDVLALINRARRAVYERSGIRLRLEVRVVGRA